MRRRPAVLLLALFVIATTEPAGAIGAAPVVHEQIPPDPHDDLALSVSIDGDLPAAMNTQSGVVGAPDPEKPVTPDEHASDSATDAKGRRFDAPANATFEPDNDTHRPDALAYDDPFTPSNAPFKRLLAFDAVDASYALVVSDPRLEPLPQHSAPAADGSEEEFYADMVVDLAPGKRVRIPSVGPGARIVHARVGVGATDVPFKMWRDGADNWFVEGGSAVRARFVAQMTVPRAAFGGEFGDPAWSDLRGVAMLPSNVRAAANKVLVELGVDHGKSPREDVKTLVAYFRSFTDSEERPTGRGNIYLDLALSRKGVCRHRAYAFMVTALALAIPTRMVMNEAHAWVEVHDGALWRRIDLGGAGRTLDESLASDVPYEPPPDPFAWPPSATRGEDLAERARGQSASQAGGNGASRNGSGRGRGKPTPTSRDPASDDPRSSSASAPSANDPTDERPLAQVTVSVVDANAKRGAGLLVRGAVIADGEPCAHSVVQVSLLEVRGSRERALGTLATGDDGTFAGSLLIPTSVPVGDYGVIARTPGDARCAGAGDRAPAGVRSGAP